MSGKCMDIGCGPGDITKNYLLPALSPNAEILGTDYSEDMIEFAKKRYNNEKRLKFEVLDIETKNLPKKYISEFDHVFSFTALHWCYDIQQAFENIYQMLRPGGDTLVIMVAYHDVFEVMKILARDSRFAPYIKDVKKYISPFNDSVHPRKELKQLLESIGFKIFECSLREMTYSSKNLKHYISSIISLYPFFDKMPHDLKEEFQDEFARELEKREFTYEKVINNQKQTFVMELYTDLIVYAQKPM